MPALWWKTPLQRPHRLGPEREGALWCAVMERALFDAGNKSRHEASTRERRFARLWLTQPSGDLDMVLHLNGIDLDFWRERVIPRLLSQWRAGVHPYRARRSQGTQRAPRPTG